MITGIKKRHKLTEIWFDEASNIVYISTYNTNLKNRLTAYVKQYPQLCHQTDDNEQGCLSFEINKKRFSIRLTAPYSERRRKMAREIMSALNKNKAK